MALLINGETVDDAVIRQEVSLTRPRYEEMVDGLDPVAKEMQLWDWSRETVIERTLLRQEALKDPEPLAAEAVDEEGIHHAGRGQREMDRNPGRQHQLIDARNPLFGVDE